MKEKTIRWRYYIDKPFQNQFMIRFSLIILIVLFVSLAILWFLRENPYAFLVEQGGLLFSMDTNKTLQCVQENGETIEIPRPNRPYNAFDLYWKPILFISVVDLIIIIVFSLFYSHSMAGPIYNIKRTLKEIMETGQYREIKVRKNDQFQDLVESINEFIKYKGGKNEN